MMAALDLTLFKKHVRADEFADDDLYLQHLLDTAEEVVVRYTNSTIEALAEANGGTFPRPLEQAAMMLAAHWYNQRESVSTTQMYEVPSSMLALIKPYRILVS